MTNSNRIYIEITHGALKALRGDNGLELSLERSPAGRLTETCREKVITDLRKFINESNWLPRLQAYCAINARGVSLRRLKMPMVAGDEFRRLLLMQIESEFPLPPAELAWGYRVLDENRQDNVTTQNVLVAAIKKDVIKEYATLFSQCGLNPTFTLAALARSAIYPQSSSDYAVLNIDDHASELSWFEKGAPVQVRIISLSRTNYEVPEAIAAFAKSLNGDGVAKTLFIAGPENSFTAISNGLLSERAKIHCAPLNLISGTGRSAAVLGLKKSVESDDPNLLFFETAKTQRRASGASVAPIKWAMLAAGLIIALLLLPYVEALLFKKRLEKQLVAIKADTGRLAQIDQKLEFLQHLKQNQPPYLDALYLFAKSAPSGAKIDSVTMNRRGDVSLRGTLRNAEQVAEFRNKLMASGFFSTVSVEEQTPTPDKQKLDVRMTAQWKPASALQLLAIGPTPDEIEKAKAKQTSPAGTPGMPPGAMPAGLPPGVRISAPSNK